MKKKFNSNVDEYLLAFKKYNTFQDSLRDLEDTLLELEEIRIQSEIKRLTKYALTEEFKLKQSEQSEERVISLPGEQ